MPLACLNIFYNKVLKDRSRNHVIQEIKKELSIFHLVAVFIIDLFHIEPKVIMEKNMEKKIRKNNKKFVIKEFPIF